jgi:hypothetical protein
MVGHRVDAGRIRIDAQHIVSQAAKFKGDGRSKGPEANAGNVTFHQVLTGRVSR